VCSIFGIFGIVEPLPEVRKRALELSKLMRHRGPDWTGSYAGSNFVMVHERLAIVDPASGAQPLKSGGLVLAANGEIYNHREIRAEESSYEYKTGSDCEAILDLFQRTPHSPKDLLNKLSGIFAFVLYDEWDERIFIARDPIGVIPLYVGWDDKGQMYVASEMKALVKHCTTIQDFPPGHFYDSELDDFVQYYEPGWRDYDAVVSNPGDPETLHSALDRATARQLMSDVPYGVLLSGGLDSSLTSFLAKKHSKMRVEDNEKSPAWWPQLHSFAIGLPGSPDLANARVAAEHIGTVHHEFEYTFQEGLDALWDVIYHIETFDVTTIRASTPMYLIARRIKSMGIKMVLTGEGSDEIFGGYLYFHKAPNAREFHEENVRKLDQLHKFDCLRANKSLAAWGVEGRVPFLDRDFLDVAMGFDPHDKMCDGRMEKHILRQAFDGSLPDEILWRQKEQFSDGVGYGWIDGLKDHAEKHVTDAQMAKAAERFPINPPYTKEGYFYREIFEHHFPGEAAARLVPEGKSIACSSPTALKWEKEFADMADPSGRAVRGVHKRSY
jgi:asparagine synthase (glutamine-hydrolysing)